MRLDWWWRSFLLKQPGRVRPYRGRIVEHLRLATEDHDVALAGATGLTLWAGGASHIHAFTTVDDYIAAQSAEAQPRLRELRAIIRAAVPEAAEVISYGMPTYRSGAAAVHFGAAKHHCALYGSAMDACAEELRGYETSKGTVRFPLDRPIPEALVHKLVAAKMAR